MKKQLDKGFEVLMTGMAGVAHIIGEPPPKSKKDDPKTDHPSSFAMSLQEQKQQKKRNR